MTERAALLIVDVQNDFCPGGALPVRDGNLVIEPINSATQFFRSAGFPVLASRDWHPPQTRHFREFGGEWPVHCVEGTTGADFHPDLQLPLDTVILSKGINPELDGYSAFEGVSAEGVMLAERLRALKIQHLFVCGLATDYCVLNSVLDACQKGFHVTVLSDAVAAVDLFPGDGTAALVRMTEAGAGLASVADLPKLLPT